MTLANIGGAVTSRSQLENGCTTTDAVNLPTPERVPYLEHSILFALDKDGDTLLQLDVLPLTSKKPSSSSAVSSSALTASSSSVQTTSAASYLLTTEWILLHMIPVTCSLSTMLTRLVKLQHEMQHTHEPVAKEDGTAVHGDMCDSKVTSLPHTHICEHVESDLCTCVSHTSSCVHVVRVGYVVSEVQSYALLIGCRSSLYAHALRRALSTDSAPGVVLPAVPVRALGMVMGRDDVFGNGTPAKVLCTTNCGMKEAECCLNANETTNESGMCEGRSTCVHLRHAITSDLALTLVNHAAPRNNISNNSNSDNHNAGSNNNPNTGMQSAVRSSPARPRVQQTPELNSANDEDVACITATNHAELLRAQDSSFPTTSTAVPFAVNSSLTRTSVMDYENAATYSSSSSEENFCAICQVELLSAKPCVITLCQHMFHLDCYARLPSTLADCPLCRFALYDTLSTARCATCQTCEDLWACLICGHVGCGRGRGNHQQSHFESTGHSCALQTSTNRIFNNHTGAFVHQEVALSLHGGHPTGCASAGPNKQTSYANMNYAQHTASSGNKSIPIHHNTLPNNNNTKGGCGSASHTHHHSGRDRNSTKDLANDNSIHRSENTGVVLKQHVEECSDAGCSSPSAITHAATSATALPQSVLPSKSPLPSSSTNAAVAMQSSHTRPNTRQEIHKDKIHPPTAHRINKLTTTTSGMHIGFNDDWWLRDTDSDNETGNSDSGGGIELQTALMESLEDRVREHYFDLLQLLIREQKAWYSMTGSAHARTGYDIDDTAASLSAVQHNAQSVDKSRKQRQQPTQCTHPHQSIGHALRCTENEQIMRVTARLLCLERSARTRIAQSFVKERQELYATERVQLRALLSQHQKLCKELQETVHIGSYRKCALQKSVHSLTQRLHELQSRTRTIDQLREREQELQAKIESTLSSI